MYLTDNRTMASSTAVTVNEYLHTSYSPDCDYVDGEVVERNVGELHHSFLQFILIRLLAEVQRTLPIEIAPELRMRVSPTRFRIPDICVMLEDQPLEPVLSTPPFLCIEILSPEDRMSRVIERVKDYDAFGVKYTWIIDPQTRTTYTYTSGMVRQVEDRLTTADPEISISIPELFAELDRRVRRER